MPRQFVQSRRTEALPHAHDVLVRFGGRSGTLVAPNSDEVAAYVAGTTTPGQNLYSAVFYGSRKARQIVRDALLHEKDDLLEANAGPLSTSTPRLQRLADARIAWSNR